MGKGQVHPSPSPAAAETADSVLTRLLPAAVLAMAAPLGAEGKEVLAYLVLASLRSPPSPAAARRIGEEEGKGKIGGSGRVAAVAQHAAELGCGCFACYTAYWSRWDGSPERDRDAIHAAIEAFEDHLARNEVEEKQEGKGSGHRRRKKRGKDKENGKAPAASAAQPPPPPAPVIVHEKEETSTAAATAASPPIAVAGGEEAKADEEEEGKTTAAAGGGGDGRRRGWGILSWKGWGQLWGAH